MTRAEFLKEHGPEWRKFARKPIFDALLSMIDDESPARKLVSTPDNDLLHGAPVFTNKISGYEGLRALLVGLEKAAEPDSEVPDKFTDSEM